MDWSRLGSAVPDALVISFGFGAVLTPPDPFAQSLYAGPAFLVALAVVYRYGHRSVAPWWRRYLVFGGVVLAASVALRVLAFAVGPELAAGVRPAVLFVGVLSAAWLAYFGGLERLRDREAVSES
ncbi:hypothetical protein [Halorussus aquaticus]|uniref:DUF3054 domain-containing protein n=1 Tax=Halorussus aquaticus TaxID=2953748 RepID=A0ABD5Q1E1_9EURY|nr:hypothetical protein [Halorussus aquaticus]